LQVYGGDLFEQADQAQDFVLAKINRAIGTRAASITAPATYELPPDAVGEAIINAIATVITTATPPSRCACSPTAWKSGTLAHCPVRSHSRACATTMHRSPTIRFSRSRFT